MSKTNITKSMMLITGTWGPTKTFKLMPTSSECPYIECIFNPSGKILAVISKNKKDSFHMVPRLNEAGEPQMKRDNKPKEQRVTLETYQEYYITELDEIKAFIKAFAENAEDYDYDHYLNLPTMETPGATGITKDTSPLIITE